MIIMADEKELLEKFGKEIQTVRNNDELFVYPKGEDKRYRYRKDKTGYDLRYNNVSENEIGFRVVIWPNPKESTYYNTLFIRIDRETAIFESEIYVERPYNKSRAFGSEDKRFYTFVGECKKTKKNKF